MRTRSTKFSYPSWNAKQQQWRHALSPWYNGMGRGTKLTNLCWLSSPTNKGLSWKSHSLSVWTAASRHCCSIAIGIPAILTIGVAMPATWHYALVLLQHTAKLCMLCWRRTDEISQSRINRSSAYYKGVVHTVLSVRQVVSLRSGLCTGWRCRCSFNTKNNVSMQMVLLRAIHHSFSYF